MLTIEGEEVGTFRLAFGCGATAGTLSITYSEMRQARDPARAGDRLSDTLLLFGNQRVPLRIETSVPRARGLSSIARGTLSTNVLKEFAEGKTRSLLVTTRMSDNARTAIRVGNTGLVALLDQVATRCGQTARPS